MSSWPGFCCYLGTHCLYRQPPCHRLPFHHLLWYFHALQMDIVQTVRSACCNCRSVVPMYMHCCCCYCCCCWLLWWSYVINLQGSWCESHQGLPYCDTDDTDSQWCPTKPLSGLYLSLFAVARAMACLYRCYYDPGTRFSVSSVASCPPPLEVWVVWMARFTPCASFSATLLFFRW